VASRNRRALVEETPGGPEPRLADLLEGLRKDDLDLVLVEGFKHERFPKIELHRPSLGRPLLFPEDESILAVATDADLPAETALPVLPLNDPEAIAAFVAAYVADGGLPAPTGDLAGRVGT
jgi:molybdopterin-guanine dinucleotide biosynthesis protein B